MSVFALVFHICYLLCLKPGLAARFDVKGFGISSRYKSVQKRPEPPLMMVEIAQALRACVVDIKDYRQTSCKDYC